MVAPTRLPAGISTFKPNQVLNTFPSVPSQNQTSVVTQEMSPFLAGEFTVTNTTATITAGLGAQGTNTGVGFNGGSTSLAVTTASGGKAGIAYNGNIATGQNIQFIPGNQVWFNVQVALNNSFIGSYSAAGGALSAGDATTLARFGLIDITDPTGTITNGVYFELPGTKNTVASAVNLVIKNTGLTGSTVTTTINNIADLARPSGIFGDTTSFGGTLTTAGSGNKFTSIAVGTAGSGYAQAPLVRLLGTGGSAPIAQAYVQIQSGALYAPYLTHIGGTGYTAFTNEVNHWIDLSLYYNGKGTLYVGVNGKLVASIGIQGTATLAAGGTATAGNSFFATNASMTTSIAPVLPQSGAFDNIMPMVALNPAVGYSLNTAATNVMVIDNIQVGSEYN
jgi:hypothetical protein